MNDLVTCTLAHPLGEEGARSVGLEPRDHEVEAEITLLRGHAMRLVAAGLVAGADPKDPESVQAALRPAQSPTPPVSSASAPAESGEAAQPSAARPARTAKPTPVGEPA
ncbi:hypothetical protein [Streptosporangium sp. NPDC051022]|uniref:hypothetical protein n=1 Tax=Streptosporangium sp. NPDC051022 TaxID=3155752 RepID=UPI0034260D47